VEEGGEGFMQKFQSALVRMNGNVGLMDDGGLLLLYSHTQYKVPVSNVTAVVRSRRWAGRKGLG